MSVNTPRQTSTIKLPKFNINTPQRKSLLSIYLWPSLLLPSFLLPSRYLLLSSPLRPLLPSPIPSPHAIRYLSMFSVPLPDPPLSSRPRLSLPPFLQYRIPPLMSLGT